MSRTAQVNQKNDHRKFTQRVRSVVKIFSLICCVILIAFTLFFAFDPVGFRKSVFQPVREILFFFSELEVTVKGQHIVNPHISAPEIVRITDGNSDRLTIVADLWRSGKQKKKPAALLLHGATNLGRKSGLIVLLGYYFQQSGWVVLAPDARGFGDSEDPGNTESSDSWNPVGDIRNCIDYLESLPTVNKKWIFVIGHSMGAGHAIEAAAGEERVRAWILIGPPRHIDGIDDSFWKRIKFSAVRDLDAPISSEVYLDHYRKGDIASDANVFLNSSYKPIMLIDGEKEGESNHRFLSKIVEKIKGPVAHYTIQNAGHYCGVYNHPFSGSIYYRPDVFEPFFSKLLNYLNGQKSSRSNELLQEEIQPNGK